MALQRLLHEGQRCCFFSGSGDEAREDLTLVIHRSPEVNHLAIQLHVHLVEVPAPVAEASHAAHPCAADVACEQRAEAVPSQPHRLMAKVDPELEQQVLYVPQAQREADVHRPPA
jgi:hypothetical protein